MRPWNKAKTAWLMASIVALALAGGLWHASRRIPLPAAEGRDLCGGPVAAAARSTLRIGTFNIHGCKGLDGRLDVGRVAALLKNLDFAGLNEVHGLWLGDKADQAELLGRELHRGWLFAPAVRQWYGYDFGNAVVSSLPVRRWQTIPLPSDPRDPRNYLRLEITWGKVVLTLFVTHATRRYPERQEEELQQVIESFLKAPEPAVLLGDMNATADHPRIRGLLDTHGVVDPLRAVDTKDAPERIDWIFVRGLRTIKAAVVENDASDHPMVWAELEGPRLPD